MTGYVSRLPLGPHSGFLSGLLLSLFFSRRCPQGSGTIYTWVEHTWSLGHSCGPSSLAVGCLSLLVRPVVQCKHHPLTWFSPPAETVTGAWRLEPQVRDLGMSGDQ